MATKTKKTLPKSEEKLAKLFKESIETIPVLVYNGKDDAQEVSLTEGIHIISHEIRGIKNEVKGITNDVGGLKDDMVKVKTTLVEHTGLLEGIKERNKLMESFKNIFGFVGRSKIVKVIRAVALVGIVVYGIAQLIIFLPVIIHFLGNIF